MYVHWTQDTITREEISSIVTSNCSTALIERLMARIARRHGRPRKRTPTNQIFLNKSNLNMPEAA